VDYGWLSLLSSLKIKIYYYFKSNIWRTIEAWYKTADFEVWLFWLDGIHRYEPRAQ